MGVGAGYTLTVKDLELDFTKIVLKRSGGKIEFEVPVKESRYDFNADHPYWGFDGTAKMSGLVRGRIKREECDVWDFYGRKNENFFDDDSKVKDCIEEDFNYYGTNIEDCFSAGWLWREPCEKWEFNDYQYSYIFGGNIDVYSAEIHSQEMADKVGYWHENSEDEEFDCCSEADFMKEAWGA